ncbi:efflux RND transporter periplasmic adaptor subunit [Phaeodactylibacter luteus]|uniref:Efflux RND transporter periplasmic adaptor subunit n=1 Tax=Phaeodactylibacter luteus TaxID=1564516 RepID=A0A5C6RHA7_9BACT|nr:efflux RND transporter periplasmic adaptor subunit [Phaeodactylibacter luteus]TXB61309.1 efflux RND transporter periplasmic adaptor subunit [Phaeodactylibacter luteus]
MKNVWLLLSFVSLMGCQAEQPAEAGSQETPASNEVGQVILSPEQLASAAVEIGQAEMREIGGYLSCSGMIDVPPASRQSVHSPVAGFVSAINKLPGQRVSRGERLAVVSHPNLVRLQRSWLEARAQLPFLEKDEARKASLAGSDAASRRDYEQALSELQLAQAREKGLRAELKLIGLDVDALAKSGEIQSQISLSAPKSGYLTQVAVQPGQLVQPEDLLFELVDKSHLHLELEVFAKDLHRVKVGQPVVAKVPGTSQEWKGRVHLLGQSVDMAKKTARVHVHFDEVPELALGTFLFAEIQTDRRTVMAVPEQAVVRTGEQAFVFAKNGEGFRKIEVALGQSDNGYLEVSSPELKPSLSLALSGAYYINGSAAE